MMLEYCLLEMPLVPHGPFGATAAQVQTRHWRRKQQARKEQPNPENAKISQPKASETVDGAEVPAVEQQMQQERRRAKSRMRAGWSPQKQTRANRLRGDCPPLL